jgi:hypothetical protein
MVPITNSKYYKTNDHLGQIFDDLKNKKTKLIKQLNTIYLVGYGKHGKYDLKSTFYEALCVFTFVLLK